MDKIRVLLAVTEFWQAGCQKYNYEIDKWLDKSKFETEIICYHDLGFNKDWPDFYYSKHKELGTKIKFVSEFEKSFGRIKKTRGYDVEALRAHFESFDKVLFQGEYCWIGYKRFLDYNSQKHFITIHNTRLQAVDNYCGFDKSVKYNFITSFTESQIRFEFEEFDDVNYFYFPLSISAKWDFEWENSFIKSKRVGIFTRLTKGKPITPFLYSFQAVVEQHPEVELYIYGNGDPEEVGFIDQIKLLNIQDKVYFKKHSTDIVKSAIDAKLSFVFFHSYHKVPGGFASFQLSSAGIPQLFFEMIPQKIFSTLSPFISTNSISVLSEKANELLSSNKIGLELAKSQFVNNRKQRDVEENIFILQEYLE